MKTVHIVSLFNRWSGECQPLKAFELEPAAAAFIAEAQSEAGDAIALPESTAAEDQAKEKAWDEFETHWGFSVLQAGDLSHASLEFVRSA